MKVILKQDIKGVGKKDQIINAADGYAKNYLFPKNLAVPADTGNMNNLKAKKDSENFRKGEELKASQNLAEKMKNMTLEFKVKAGENGRLFGCITAKEIAETLKKADIVEKELVNLYQISIDYTFIRKFEHLLKQHNIKCINQEYNEQVSYHCYIKDVHFLTLIQELTSNQFRYEIIGQEYIEKEN